ncbi:MAG: hypothetical protein Q8P02_04180, partial [Candidatus Micrarchaeota archaeon]|nr:hypothetical protein [Candidatus Micrarchaeota archaeon]
MNKLQAFFLLAAVALSVFTHAGVWDSYLAPTYGNTGIHQANARELVETGAYPLDNDFSYGGGIPNLYVPIYRFALAQLAMAGLDFDFAQRLIVMLFALALPIGFFVFASAFGQWQGVAAAFLASLPAELLIYTIRPLPQAMGLVMLAFAFGFIAKNHWAAIATGVLIALTHQEAAVFFAMGAFAYGISAKAYDYWRKTESQNAMLALYAWAATTATYFLWNYFTLGHFNVFALAQFQHHEGAVVTLSMLAEKTGLLVLALSAIGLLFALLEMRKAILQKKPACIRVLGIAVLLVGIFAIKNDLVGISVFMDRFIVFLQFPLILFAAHGTVQGLRWLSDAT